MYDFVDPSKMGYNRNKSTEALIWNGKVVDEELVGFRTLSVEGRENLTYEINKVQRQQAGDVEMGTSIGSKTIKVKFLIETDNSRDFNNTWYALKLLVSNSKQRFTFADEMDTYRIGTVQSIVNEKSGAYTTTGYIEIYQSDPFIYGKRKTVTFKASSNNPIVFKDSDLLMGVRPTNLSFVFNIAIGAPAIGFVDPHTSEKYTVQVTTPVKAGDRLSVNMDTGNVYLNGDKKDNALSISSDIGNFKLVDGSITDNSNSMLREIQYTYDTKRI